MISHLGFSPETKKERNKKTPEVLDGKAVGLLLSLCVGLSELAAHLQLSFPRQSQLGRQGTSSGKAQNTLREALLSNYPDEITIRSWAQAASRVADALIHRSAPRDAGRAESRGAGSAVFLT